MMSRWGKIIGVWNTRGSGPRSTAAGAQGLDRDLIRRAAL
jgi:hypothetical protein